MIDLIKTAACIVSTFFLVSCGGSEITIAEDIEQYIMDPEPPTEYSNITAALTGTDNLTAVVLATKSNTGQAGISSPDASQSTDGSSVSIYGTETAVLNGVKLGSTLDTGYEYLASTDQFVYEIAGVEYDGIAIVGVQTLSSDMPQSGVNAKYTGQARATLQTNEGAFEMTDGTANIQVVISEAETSATARLAEFEIHSTSLSGAMSPIDEIEINWLSTGSSWIGSEWVSGLTYFYKDGEIVEFDGAIRDDRSKLLFFGIDENTKLPAELAGVHRVEADSFSLEAIFTGK